MELPQARPRCLAVAGLRRGPRVASPPHPPLQSHIELDLQPLRQRLALGYPPFERLAAHLSVRGGWLPGPVIQLWTIERRVRGFLDPPPASLSPGHIALFEAAWRAVHMLATIATRQMRYQEIDELVGAAHNAMRETMTKRKRPHRVCAPSP